MATPRTLIRALAADSEEKPAAVEQQQHMPTTSMLPPPAPPRRGGSGAITMSEDETPRRIIAGLAAGLDTEERLTESSSKRRRRGSNLPSAGGNSNDPKNMIRRFLRDAKTDSREKSPTRRDEYYALEDRYSPSTRMDDGEEEEEEAWFEEEEEGLPAAPVAIVDKAPPGVVYLKHAKRAPKSEKRSDPFARECSQSFKAFLSRLPKPNRAQGEEVLEVAEEAAQAYLKQTARDYARLAKLDDASTHHMTKDRLELLLREQGLLVGNLGDEIRRLLDKEDAERALALPVSRARLERM